MHFTKIEGDQMPKIDLCEACAKEKGVSDPSAFAFDDLFLGTGLVQEIEPLTAGEIVKCPHCGYTVLVNLGKGKNKRVELSLLVHPQWLAGEAKQGSPSSLRATRTNSGPGRTTFITPSSLRK